MLPRARPFILSLVLVAGAAASQSPPAAAPPSPPSPPSPPACESPEHHQFDFWVGRWDVYPTGTDQLIAHSLIERLYAGCAIRENWMPIDGAGSGGSLNMYRPAERQWRQVWTDSGNTVTDFRGGMEGGRMVLTGSRPGPAGQEVLVRIEFTVNPDGSVRQVGTRSRDQGATWLPRYDFTYRRSANP